MPPQCQDRAAWAPLWDGYNAYYGRKGATALNPAITEATLPRFFDPIEPVIGPVYAHDASGC